MTISAEAPIEESPTETQTRELIFCPGGLLGFEHLTRFILTPYDDELPFYWLRSLEEEAIAFVVIEPHQFQQDYAFDLPDDVATELQIESAQDAFALVILTIPEQLAQMTANLAGPLIFNVHTNHGRQLVLDSSRYPLRYPLFPEGLPDEAAQETQV